MGKADALFDGSNSHLLGEQLEAGSPEHKAALYLARKKDVTRVAGIVSPYLLAEADKADELDQEDVTVSVSSVYSALDVMAFIESLEMYEKDLREEMERLKTKSKAWELMAKSHGKLIGGELYQLEQSIAYASARSDIECYCEGARHSGPHIGVWYDITTPEPDEAKEMVGEAVRYLVLRKLLKYHPESSSLVRPLDVLAEAVRP